MRGFAIPTLATVRTVGSKMGEGDPNPVPLELRMIRKTGQSLDPVFAKQQLDIEVKAVAQNDQHSSLPS